MSFPTIPTSPDSRHVCPAVELDLAVSWRLASGAFAWFAAVCATCLYAPLPWAARIGALAAVAWAGYPTVVRDVLLRGELAILHLAWDSEGSWRLTDAAGRTRRAQLSPASAALGGVLILHFRTDRGRQICLLDGRALDPGRWRALCRRLRIETAAGRGAC